MAEQDTAEANTAEQEPAGSGPADPGPAGSGPAGSGPADSGPADSAERTWKGAIGEVWQSALKHKVASVIVALCVVGSLVGIGLASSSSSAAAGAGSGQVAKTADSAAPAFSLPALGHSGQHVSLASYAGKPLIVNFFASWCVPCKAETPLLAKFYRSEHAKVALVGLDENDVLANATSFTHSDGVTYPVGFDPDFTAANAYGVNALPQTFFLNAKHRIVDRIFGAVTLADLSKGIALATGS